MPEYGHPSSGHRPPSGKPVAAPKSPSPIFSVLCAELLPMCAACGARVLRAQVSSVFRLNGLFLGVVFLGGLTVSARCWY